jgi:hypothetical protein
MALSDDQRALLRLLAQREEGYEDIAALKGLSVAQIRAEVRDALAELQAGEPTAPPPPVPPAPFKESPAAAPEPPAATPEPPPSPAPPTAPQAKRRAIAASPAVSPERRRLVLLAAAALGIVAVVIGAIAIFSGGSGSSSSEASAGAGETAAAAAESGNVTQAVLTAADGSEASGKAIFGRVGKKEVVLQVTAEGLQPAQSGQSYTVWLYRSPKLSLRVGSVAVGDSGRLGARFPIPAELLAYVASGAFDQIYVSRTEDAAYREEVARARAKKSLPRYTGETVLSGEITGPVAKR